MTAGISRRAAMWLHGITNSPAGPPRPAGEGRDAAPRQRPAHLTPLPARLPMHPLRWLLAKLDAAADRRIETEVDARVAEIRDEDRWSAYFESLRKDS